MFLDFKSQNASGSKGQKGWGKCKFLCGLSLLLYRSRHGVGSVLLLYAKCGDIYKGHLWAQKL